MNATTINPVCRFCGDEFDPHNPAQMAIWGHAACVFRASVTASAAPADYEARALRIWRLRTAHKRQAREVAHR